MTAAGSRTSRVGLLLALAGVLGAPAHAGPSLAGAPHWVAAWAAAPLRAPMIANPVLRVPPRNPEVDGRTLRMVVRLDASGARLRLHLDNRYGDRPLHLGAVTVARPAAGAPLAVVSSSLASVAFAGAREVTIPAGGAIDSDPLAMRVRAGEAIAVSLFVPAAAVASTWHPDARYGQALSAVGDFSQVARIPHPTIAPGSDWLTRVDVQAPGATGAIVTLGDSITNGFRASPGGSYPERLAGRLRAARCGQAVVNAGIDGNQVAAARGDFSQGASMVSRLASDVLDVPGARYLMLLGGINDIGEPTMAARATGQPLPEARALAAPVVAGLERIARSAHQCGLRVYGATLPPFGGTDRAYSEQGEAARKTVNAWIRTRAPFDAVIDFDAVLRDPAQPSRLRPSLESGDHIHPNDAGYRAMAQSVPLALFGCSAGTPAAAVRRPFSSSGVRP
ncbi:MAG TPA: GDSL-type esterase/lipase family protein [Frateuria sp.]|uniref:GDSL-type esterase/lipase family protein n=1 Tax=Frateuria sp. TaxID=2211372 RepID=UPI002DECBB7C|nr:GDSL-type esterase/lipase family protein [Frateuria sp.]